MTLPTPMDELDLSPTDALVAALVSRMMEQTSRFNAEITNLPIPALPATLPAARVEWAQTAFNEEIKEFTEACEMGDPLEAADAILDLVFFALGRICEMGIPTQAIWEGIMRANMEKKQGSLAKRPGSLGHDAIKPEGWKPPDHSWLMSFSLADLEKARLFDETSPVFQDLTRLRAAKGSDYNNVPGGRDAYFPFGHFSYAHMLNTKNLRLQSLISSFQAGKNPNFEGILDTVKDLVNYGAFYAEAMMDGRVTMNLLPSNVGSRVGVAEGGSQA